MKNSVFYIYPNGLVSFLGVKLGMTYNSASDILLKQGYKVEKNEYNGVDCGGILVKDVALYGMSGWNVIFRSFFGNRVHSILVLNVSSIYNEIESVGEKIISEISQFKKYVNTDRYREKSDDKYLKTRHFDNTSFSNTFSYINVSMQYDSDESIKNQSSHLIFNIDIRCTIGIPKADFSNITVHRILNSYIDKYLYDTQNKAVVPNGNYYKLNSTNKLHSFIKIFIISFAIIVAAYLFALQSRYQVVYNGRGIVDKWTGTIETVRIK